MTDPDHGDPFASPNLWAPSILLNPVFEVPISSIDKLESIPAKWPDLDSCPEDVFVFPKTDGSGWPEIVQAITPIDFTHGSVEVPSSDDAWSISTEDIAHTKQPPEKSWEQHADPAFNATYKFLTEAGVAETDAALRQKLPAKTSGRPLKPELFLRCLFQLGLGRSSALFAFQSDDSFSVKVMNPRMYGLTPECTRSVVSSFGRCGQRLRALKQAITRIYGKRRYSATIVATAQTVSSIVLELDTQVAASYGVQSLLQLQNSFKLPMSILPLLQDMLSELSRMRTDQEALSYVFGLAQDIERSKPSLKPLMTHIIAKVSEPWLRAVAACIGMRPTDASSETFRASLLESLELDNTSEDEDEVFPKWFSMDDRNTVRQIFESMSLLDRQGLNGLFQPKDGNEVLAWEFAWPGRSHGKAIEQCNPTPAGSATAEYGQMNFFDPVFEDNADPTESIYNSYRLFEESRDHWDGQDPGLKAILKTLLTGHDDSNPVGTPSFEIAALTSFQPFLAARARVVNHACLKELFRPGHDARTGRPVSLTYHLDVLNRFLLMTDGMFTTRLSHALLDPDLSSAERSKGEVRYGNMGLRLGSRSTWPPASSELQLALMGILTSAFEDEPCDSPNRAAELPGDLSFALRQLSEDEIQRCLDQSSLEALDFLRVQYRPAPPLDSIITPHILQKYDSIQRLLLRMIRLVFVINHLSRLRIQRTDRSKQGQTSFAGPALKFVHAAHHFITAFTDYLLNTAIASNWAHLRAEVTELDNAISRGESSTVQDRGISHIRALHERTLDNIMFACLLRKRHDKVRGLLEDILSLILEYAAVQTHDEAMAAELYVRFKSQVALFINVCKGLGERKEYAGMQEGGLQALVTRLTVNDFYSSNTERVLRL